MRSRRFPLLAAALVVASIAAACGGGGGSSAKPGEGSGSGNDSAARCPVGAIAKAPTKPVPVTFWHSMVRANADALAKLADRFNASHPAIKVALVNQTSYEDTLTKYRAALGGGTLPDLVQIQDVDQRLMIDSRSVLPAGACVTATEYDISDVLPRILSYYTVDGTLWSLPFGVSNPVLYFNKQAFQKAGLDPDKPPATLDQLRAASQELVTSGVVKYGLSLKQDPWYLEEWHGTAGRLYADHDNGRKGRAGAVMFGGETGAEIFRWIAAMSKDKLAQLTSSTSFDNLLSIGNGAAAMTLETSAALGTILQVLGSGQFPNVTLGVAPLPGPTGDGGTVVAGSTLFLVNRSAPARQEAAWTFARWLDEPEQMAEWAAATGYIPIRTKAADLPVIQDLWKHTPEFRVAYDQIKGGTDNAASAGPVIGDMEAVRVVIRDALQSLFKGADPDATLRQAVEGANRAIENYESRIG